MKRNAIISECGTFRYLLSREWDEALPPLLFVMLNPSTADALVDDATIRRCIAFAQAHGFGRIEVVNLFAYRATDPEDLRRAGYLVGPDNDWHIRVAAKLALFKGGDVCLAWGDVPAADERIQRVLPMLRDAGAAPKCLYITRSGYPGHPLSKRLRSYDATAIEDAMTDSGRAPR